MTPPLLELRNVSCSKDEDQVLFADVNLTLNQGDVVVLQGKSGSGKTTLLKCIAHLSLYGGDILYNGSTPRAYGIPAYRTRVLYVPQRPSLLPGSPRDFLITVTSFKARQTHTKVKSTNLDDVIDIATAWGIEPHLWDREWSNLSGGESQRIALAVAVGLNTAQVLLLDEPTSALDPESSQLVEQLMTGEVQSAESSLKAILWITHSEEQGGRVGTRFIQISANGCHEEALPPV